MTLRPDADLANADWPKIGFWDLPRDHDYWQRLDIRAIENLMELPAWRAVPDDIREIVEARLAEVAD